MELESLNAISVIDIFLLLLIGIGPKIALVPFLLRGGVRRRRPAHPDTRAGRWVFRWAAQVSHRLNHLTSH